MRIVSGVVCALLFAGISQAQDQAGSRDVKLRAGGDRSLQINQVDTSRFPKVDIFATVLEGGAPVTGLGAPDFRVREDEVDQEPLTVAAQASPLSVVVTVDTSGSMSKAMQATREAAQHFVDSLAPQDSVAVVSFNRGVQVLANPGTPRDQAKQVISGLQARGDTALFDAIHASLEVLKGRPGRKAIVLLSDGVDDDGTGKVLSKHSVDEGLKLAQELNVPVFTVGLGSELDEVTLQRVASQSGAGFYKAPSADQLRTLYSQLGQQLTGQYQISYTSNLPGDGSIHTIQLTQAALRSTKGYSSPSNGAAPVQPVVAAPVVSAAPVAAAGSHVVEIVAGTSPENAPLIQMNQRYVIKAAQEGGVPVNRMFVAFDGQSGTHLSALAEGTRGKGDCSRVYWYTPRLREVMGQFDCDSNVVITDSWTVTEETKGRGYIDLRDFATAKMTLFSFPVDDAGSGHDAGESEASAVPLTIGNSVSGVLREHVDIQDTYKVQVSGGSEYQVRVRPDLKTSLEVTVFDEDGVKVDKKSSQNAGAGVTIDLKPKSAMSATIGVKITDGEGYGRYSVVVGPQGVSAPAQPEAVSIPNKVTQ